MPDTPPRPPGWPFDEAPEPTDAPPAPFDPPSEPSPSTQPPEPVFEPPTPPTSTTPPPGPVFEPPSPPPREPAAPTTSPGQPPPPAYPAPPPPHAAGAAHQPPPPAYPGHQPPPPVYPGHQPPPPAYPAPPHGGGAYEPPPPGGYPPGQYQPAPGYYGEPPRKSRTKVIVLTLLGIVVACGILIGACAVWFISTVTAPVDEANRFLAAVDRTDYAAAVNMSDPACNFGMSVAVLDDLFARQDIDYDLSSSNISNGQATVSGSLRIAGASQGTITLSLRKTGDDWRVCGFNF